jgi:hypothetical protein
MVYKDNEIPYFYNLVDMYRHQAKYNNGYAYNMMFVGPGWLNKAGRWEAPYALLKKAYEDGLDYYAKLKKEGRLVDMTMSEFAAFYRKSHPSYMTPEVALWKDVLYGFQKEYFWYCDPFLRTCLDFNQGGAMIDLRPYAAKLAIPVGIGTGNAYDATYPYIIEANYRAGYFTHYAGQGTIKSCRVKRKEEIVDLCLERTMATFSKEGDDAVVTTDPFEVKLADTTLTMQSAFRFEKGKGIVEVTRRILANSASVPVTLEEYLVGCYGREEYSLDMTGIRLEVIGAKTKRLSYAYKGRALEEDKASAKATIPPIDTVVALTGEGLLARVEEGIAFSPMFTLSVEKTLTKGELTSCLSLKKAR